MRRMGWLLAGALLSVVALGSDSPQEYDDKVEYVGIEGTWKLVSIEHDGKIYPQSEGGTVFHNSKWAETRPGCALLKGHYKINTKQKPAWVDRTVTNRLPRDYTIRGIYRIDGDLLRIAWILLPPDLRAESFDTKPDDGLYVYTFKRVK